MLGRLDAGPWGEACFNVAATKSVIVVLLLMFAVDQNVQAQLRWEPLEPFDGGRVSAIRLVNGNLFIVNEMLHVLDNSGQWQEAQGILEGRRWFQVSIDYANGLYLLAGAHQAADGSDYVSRGDLFSSRDGLLWNREESLDVGQFTDLKFLNSRWILVGWEQISGELVRFIMISEDGQDWQRHESDDYFELSPQLYTNGNYVALRKFGSPAYSSDAINWIDVRIDSDTKVSIENPFRIFSENSLFVFAVDWECTILPAAPSSCSRPPRIFTSRDGQNWTVHFPEINAIRDVFYFEPEFIILGSTDVLYSSDGQVWRKTSFSREEAAPIWGGITYSNDYFYGIDPKGAVWRSPLAIELSYGSNWKYLPWFGFYNDSVAPWIYHEELGWMWRDSGAFLDRFWLWDASLGYLWTDSEVYPSIYRERDGTWIWYARGTSSPRYFFNFSTDEWETW